MDCRPPCVDGAPSSSSDDSRETKRSDVVANGVVFFGLMFRVTGRVGCKARLRYTTSQSVWEYACTGYEFMGVTVNGMARAAQSRTHQKKVETGEEVCRRDQSQSNAIQE